MFDKRLFQTPPRPSMVVASWKEPIPGVLMAITTNCKNTFFWSVQISITYDGERHTCKDNHSAVQHVKNEEI